MFHHRPRGRHSLHIDHRLERCLLRLYSHSYSKRSPYFFMIIIMNIKKVHLRLVTFFLQSTALPWTRRSGLQTCRRDTCWKFKTTSKGSQNKTCVYSLIDISLIFGLSKFHIRFPRFLLAFLASFSSQLTILAFFLDDLNLRLIRHKTLQPNKKIPHPANKLFSLNS